MLPEEQEQEQEQEQEPETQDTGALPPNRDAGEQ